MKSLLEFKESQFDIFKSNTEKAIIMGRLEMLKDLAIYIDNLREAYTRTLVVNGVTEEEYEETISGKEEKKEKIEKIEPVEINEKVI